jgi:flotillin
MQAKRRAAAEVFNTQQQAKETLPATQLPEPAWPDGQEDEGETGAGVPPAESAALPASRVRSAPYRPPAIISSEELQLEKEPLKVQEKGWGLWKRVIVPPNAYVVHTRLGRPEPVTLGLGLSFRYNPFRDAYLIVPAAMQTIGVVANCISKEKQGINILAYLQWQIADFSRAYRKLDFSDSREPLGIVNAQLREQAEAAIKDKIATMSVEEVLTDKAPVIQELTTRLKHVAEGDAQSGAGLGIKIVTVQIREGLVSSTRLWEDLQAPFRHQQQKNARISYLEMQHQIRQKELETRRVTEISQAETLLEIERTKQAKQTETLDVQLTEATKRRDKQQEADRHQADIEQADRLAALQREHTRELEQATLAANAAGQRKTLEVAQHLHALQEQDRLEEAKTGSDRQRLQAEQQLRQQQAEYALQTQEQADRLKAMELEADLARQSQARRNELALEEAGQQVQLAFEAKRTVLYRDYQEARNLVRDPALRQQLIEKLPDIAAAMPEVQELRVLQTGAGMTGLDALTGFVAKLLAVAESLGVTRTGEPPAE